MYKYTHPHEFSSSTEPNLLATCVNSYKFTIFPHILEFLILFCLNTIALSFDTFMFDLSIAKDYLHRASLFLKCDSFETADHFINKTVQIIKDFV